MTIPMNTISTVISRYTSEYKVEGDYGKIKKLIFLSFKRLGIFGILGFILMLIASYPISLFLRITVIQVLILSTCVIFQFLIPVNNGLFQGLQKFKLRGIAENVGPLIRISFALIIISLGFGINAVIFTFPLSQMLTFLFSLYFLNKLLSKKEINGKLDVKGIYKYSYPILISSSIILLMQNIDILLVKHFFLPAEAGIYSAASNLGKIIIFVLAGISESIFPKVSELASSKKSSLKVLKHGLFYASLISIAFILSSILFREEITVLLFGKQYLASAYLLPYFSVSMSFLGIATILFRYSMAIKNFRYILPLSLSFLGQVVAVMIYHNSLLEIVIILNIFYFLNILIGLIFFKK
jgi:O-antigen/teichoic acid export membrane protein